MFEKSDIFNYATSMEVETLLHLPVSIDVKRDFVVILEERLNNFVNQLAIPFLNERGLQEDSIHISYLKTLKEGILTALKTQRYESFKSTLDDVKFMEIAPKKELTSDMLLFRSRLGYFQEKEDFYHLPFDKIEKSKCGRFNTNGEITWYLGESRDVCWLEMNNVDNVISTMKLNFKKGEKSLSLIDITAENLYSSNDYKLEYEIVLFPLVLACYCIAEGDDTNVMYLVPQFLSRYIREKRKEYNISGIQYFTVRNEELNPKHSTYKNVGLFPERNICNYDMNLMDKFMFNEIYYKTHKTY